MRPTRRLDRPDVSQQVLATAVPERFCDVTGDHDNQGTRRAGIAQWMSEHQSSDGVRVVRS